ncbi:MAG: helix-hairpin-helix domain-containing protein [Clostridia bacterium]|nr:helix-hairpin-helix domain-containing protein [Clostridia bacterium]
MDNKFKSAIAFGGFIIFVIIIGVIFSDGTVTSSSEEEIIIDNMLQDESGNIEENLICVYIIGAVNEPGIALVPEDSRLYEAIECVGGFAENADTNLINLASTVSDGEKIVIPFIEKLSSKAEASKVQQINELYHGNATKNSELVNINTATKEELKTLSGIGDSTADKIIEYRNTVSKFKNIEEIKNVSRHRRSKI